MSTPTPKSRTLTLSLIGLALVAFAGFAYVMSSGLNPDSSQTAQNTQTSPSPGQSADSSSTETSPETSTDNGSLEGKPAPEFQVTDLKGQPVSLAAYRGKVVFLNFWATWCEPCKKEMPSMERLYQKMKGRPFEILAISLDATPEKDIPTFLDKTKIQLSFPLLADKSQNVSKQLYKTTGVPESFIIGPDGKVVKHAIGIYEWDSPEIFQFFDELVKAVKAEAAPATRQG